MLKVVLVAVLLVPFCLTVAAQTDGADLRMPADVIRSHQKADAQSALPSTTVTSNAFPQTTVTANPSEEEARGPFQLFVETSLGKRLPIFGAELFRGVPSTFAPVDRIPVTSTYVIGPGDELVIRAWGQIDVDVTAVVDRNGSVFLPRVGELHVAGLRYEQLQEYAKNAIGRLYRNFDVSVTLGQLRSIQVFVVGNARRPGAYTVSSLSTLVNALFASGGPAIHGSMRRIELRRASGGKSEFDLYDLLRGDKSKDAVLAAGDVIYIPPVGGLVAIEGSVNLPAIYELKDKETLGDVIVLAGGLTSTATEERASIERIEKRSIRTVLELRLDTAGLQNKLADGDVVRVAQISSRFEKAVTLRGNVARPGRYPYREGMSIHDLIPTRESLITDDYWAGQNRLASTPAGAAAGQSTTEVRNHVKRSTAEINWDYALIERLDAQDLSTRLIPFHLEKAIADAASADNLVLESGDVVTIFSQADLRTPIHRQSKLVRLEGEFAAAGVYRAEATESLRKLVERAGGLTGEAYLHGSEFTRESVREEQETRLQALVRETEQQIENMVAQRKAPEDQVRVEQELASRRAMLAKLKQLKPTGRIVLELAPVAKDTSALPDLVLEDGDRIFVPHSPASVMVLGAVFNENSFLYKADKSVEQYLASAGGATRDGDRGRMYIVHVDGSVANRAVGLFHSTWESKLLPGDTIVVPVRMERSSLIRGLKDWSQVISQFALGAAAVRVLERN